MTGWTIHQTLHGYRSGHSLLTSSLELPSTSQVTMLQRSDLSGPVFHADFESYLTAYPLSEVGMYVFARTWSATEVHRPGTVWTHSLLISFGDLAEIKYLGALEDLLRRPDGSDFSSYSAALRLERDSAHASTTREDVARLVAGLYGRPTEPLRLTAPAAATYEPAAISVWSQQWPRLRRAFQFCTGVLSGGNSSFETFDLQIGPRGWTGATPEDSRSSEPWLSVAVDDVVQGGAALRSYLHEHGAEAASGRSDFVPLVNLYLASQSERLADPAESLLSGLAQLGGDRDSFSRLKVSLLGRRKDLQEELAVLCAVLRDTRGVVDLAQLDVAARAKSLVEAAPTLGVSLLRCVVQSPNPDTAEQIVRDAATVLRDVPLSLQESDFQLALALVAIRPEFAATDWALPADALQQRQMLEVLGRSESVPQPVARSVARRLMAVASPLADEALASLGDVAAFQVLDQLSTEPGTVPALWRDAVTRRRDVVVTWLRSRPLMGLGSASLVARALRSEELASPNYFESWSALALSIQDGVDDVLLASLFLAAARMPEVPGLRLTERTFQPLHDRILSSRLSSAAWSPLQRELPHLGFFSDWDMGEKLRRGLADRFVLNRWRPCGVLTAVPDPDTLGRVLGYLRSWDAGDEYLRALCSDADNGEIRVSSVQADVLAAWCPRGRGRRGR